MQKMQSNMVLLMKSGKLDNSPITPCIGVCRVNSESICKGCGRSVQDIINWPRYSDSERLKIMENLPDMTPKV